MSGISEDVPINCTILFYKISVEHNNLIVCLRIYINELYNLFFTEPNLIFLLYDKTSEESFKGISLFYENSLKNKKYENIKFIVVGNKKDLISEVEESDEISSKNIQINITKEDNNKDDINKENKKKEDTNNDNKINKDKKNEDENNDKKINEDNNNEDNNNDNINANEICINENKEGKEKNEDKEDKENNEDKENKENNENKEDKENKENNKNKEDKEDKEDEPLLNLDQKIEKFCKEKKIMHWEISGYSGEGVMELFEEIVYILFKDIKTIQEDEKQLNDTSSFSKNIENELNLSSRQSYHSDDYKKEINKINKKRKILCCYRCNIF